MFHLHFETNSKSWTWSSAREEWSLKESLNLAMSHRPEYMSKYSSKGAFAGLAVEDLPSEEEEEEPVIIESVIQPACVIVWQRIAHVLMFALIKT